METRARRAAAERIEALPQEVWQLIVSFLAPPEAVRVSLVCSDFAAISTAGAQAACRRLWPQHAKRLAACGPSGVQRFLKLVQAHEEETASHPDIGKAKSVQKTVCPAHRQIAVEWLIEVSWDWQLESTVVYRGAQYLDHYLATHAVPALSKFQMLAISCLRTALKHSSKLAEREHQRLPFKHWAEVTDGACTEAEVRSTCAKLERMLHQQERSHPNAKQRLRYLWYRLFDGGAVKQDHVFIYMLASFLLHLSLLDSTLSAVTPTKLALAALSLALKVFGLPPMPPVLAEHCFYLEEELQEVQQQLALAQEQVVGQQLRALWVQSYSYVGSHPSQQPAYTLLQQLVTAPGKISYLPASSSNSSSSERKAAPSVAAAAPAATGAAATAAAAQAAPEAAAGAGSAGTVNRVMTRAAAAAGLAHNNRQQHVPAAVPPAAAAPFAAAAAAATTVPSAERNSRHGAGSSRAGAAAAAAAAAPPAQPPCADNDQGAALATPQRPAAVGGAPMAPTLGPLHPFAVVFEPITAATPPATLAAAAATTTTAAAHHSEPHTGGHQQQPPSTGPGSTARRCPTRELPPRRAVAVSRYGMLASRSTHGTPSGPGSAPQADGPSSSGRAAAAHGAAGGSSAHQRYGSSSWHAGPSRACAGAAPAALTAAAGAAGSGEAPSGLQLAAGAGPSSSRVRPAGAGAAAASAGSMTPASPKHATAGTRGLAALFAGVGPGGASSSHAGASGSSTGRLLSGLPSLQVKLSTGDSEGLQDRLLSEDPSWLWSVHQYEHSSHGSDGGKPGPQSSGSNGGLHHTSVPVLRSMRRGHTATAAAGAGSHHGHDSNDVLHKLHERPGVHTRSSSSGGSADAGSSHWQSLSNGGSRLSHHAHHD